MCKISVIIAVYNVEEYIAECIESFLSDPIDFELIIVCTRSEDKTDVICEEYARKDSRVKIIYQPKLGVSAARNEALKHIKGEYVYFADSDDYITKGSLTLMYDKAKGNALDILRVGADNFTDHEEYRAEVMMQKDHYIPTEEDETARSGPDILAEALKSGEFVSAAWAHLYRRSFLESIDFKFPNMKMHEDTCTTFYIWAKAKRCMRIKNVVYNRRMRPGSLIHSKENDYSFTVYMDECMRLLDYYDASGAAEGVGLAALLEARRVLNHALLIHREGCCDAQAHIDRFNVFIRRLDETAAKASDQEEAELFGAMHKMAEDPENKELDDKKVYLV